MASPEQPGGSVVCFSWWPSQHPGSAPRFVDRPTFDAYFIEAGSEFYRRLRPRVWCTTGLVVGVS